MSRRGATPSYESSQQSHIDDLVQRNRASEHAHRKLKEELTQEKARAKLAIQDIQNKLHAEKREWREACDTLQTCNRIHQLRLQAELEKGKYQLLVEQELLRKEKVAALQRELAITKFQAQETSLEHRIEDLEDKLAKLGQQLQDEKHASKAQILKLVTHMQTQEKELEAAEEARADNQAELDGLHRANAESQVSSDSLGVKLERTTLQLDGARSKNADLERANEELKLSNEELKRQVAKWQSLESKGGTEMETSRKKRVELEVQLQAVQNQLTKREEEDAKMQKRLEKSKQRIQEWQEEAEEWKKKYGRLERDMKKFAALKQTRDTVPPTDSEEEIAQAMTQTVPPSSPAPPVGTSRRKPPSSKPAPRQTHKGAVPAAATSSSHTPPEVDADEEVTVVAPTRGKGKGKAKATETESDAGTEAEQHRKQRKPKSKQAASGSGTGSEIEAVAPTRGKGKGKAKAIETESDAGTETEPRRKQRKPKSKQPSGNGSGSEIEVLSAEDSTAAAGKRNGPKARKEAEVERKGKRKATSPPADDGSREPSEAPLKRTKRNDDTEQPKPKPNGRGGRGKAAAAAAPSRAESTASTVTVEPEAGGSGSQKPVASKKRKINVFQPPGNKTNLSDFNFGSQGSVIPSVLSPLKPQDAVPARSMSFLGSLLRR
ncbi:hypothetical protein BT96DRAFT_993225 [Gymnopus androsaceus JB14]|uniref:Uncharacterized protein n=1 Tax=Gymnopus androsaceus JB14 TaxID=1447944 RepID=A0A6A4HMP1_9AGAR|nr:hypothetical protein BT96DRAFT_993225 [Gymnopus androsaceus JB14]